MTNYYFTGTNATTNGALLTGGGNITIVGTATYNDPCLSIRIEDKKGISPILYFKYIKSKFKILEKITLDRRLKKIEKAFDVAMNTGQEALSKKILEAVIKEAKESAIYAKGGRYFIERDDLQRHKNRIKGGHISDTLLKDYIRVIPKDVLAKKEKFDGVFDDFVIYHYYNEKQADLKKMTSDEKAKMKDPVLFGIIKETNRLYFVADWEDEYCDLTFDEMIGIIGGPDGSNELSKYPEPLC